MQFPTVHLNGTPKQHLLDQLTESIYALCAAEQAIQNTEPHGRDYPTGRNAYSRARQEHILRLERISMIRNELLRITEHISKGPPDESKGVEVYDI